MKSSHFHVETSEVYL